MSSTFFDPPNQGVWQPTKLAEFCQAICLAHAKRLQELRVRLNCDVASDLEYDLPRLEVRRILDAWIEEALSVLPVGGELDITVVLGSAGLEIEVADSRDTDLHESRDYWHRHVKIADEVVVDSASGSPLPCESASCPQGGVARTVTVPPRESVVSEARPAWWRKVA